MLMMTNEKPPSRALVFLVIVIALMLGSSYVFGASISDGNSASVKSGHAKLTPTSGSLILPKGQQVSVFSGIFLNRIHSFFHFIHFSGCIGRFIYHTMDDKSTTDSLKRGKMN